MRIYCIPKRGEDWRTHSEKKEIDGNARRVECDRTESNVAAQVGRATFLLRSSPGAQTGILFR